MKSTVLRYSVTVAVGLAVALIVMSFKGVFTQTDSVAAMRILCDSFFVSGVCIVCIGLIVVLSNGGAFDMLSYAVVLIFDALRKDVTKRKYKDFYSYREAKKDRKRGFGFLLIVGFALVGISLCFLAAYYGLK